MQAVILSQRFLVVVVPALGKEVLRNCLVLVLRDAIIAAMVTTLSLLSLSPPFPFFLPLQVSWLGEEPVAGVWSEKGQVEIYALRRLLQVVDDPQALATFLRDEQTRVKPIFTFAGHMGEGFALDWSPRVCGESWG